MEDYESGSPIAEISENFGLPEDLIRAVLDYAAVRHPAYRFVKVLFDRNVPRKLRRYLRQQDVATAEEMNWHELESGHRSAAAETPGLS